jgi:hypothetical protein
MMTTMSAIFGILPIAIGIGAGSELRQPRRRRRARGFSGADPIHDPGHLRLHGAPE